MGAACVVCTWNGVVQNESEETSNEHVGGKKHQNNLVQLFHSLKKERRYINNNNTFFTRSNKVSSIKTYSKDGDKI